MVKNLLYASAAPLVSSVIVVLVAVCFCDDFTTIKRGFMVAAMFALWGINMVLLAILWEIGKG